jgi:prepilin-type N-terminal cleavage/methylation domain-containing protein
MPYRLECDLNRSTSEGFSLLEVLVATALVGLMLVVLLQILSTIFRTEEGIWKNNRALLVAERVLQESSTSSSLAAEVYQGREEEFSYQVKVTPQYEISGPAGELQLRCALIQVTVSWQERGRSKRLVLETARTAAPRNS